MIRRLKVYHDFRIKGPRPSALHIPSALLEAACIDGASEVVAETAHGSITITADASTAPPLTDRRRTDAERIEHAAAELCKRMGRPKMLDFARVCVTYGVEIGISR